MGGRAGRVVVLSLCALFGGACDGATGGGDTPTADAVVVDVSVLDASVLDAPVDDATRDDVAEGGVEIAVDSATPIDAAIADAFDATPDSAGVTIDLSKAIVKNSPPDVASWPVTAKITTLDLGATGVHIDFTKRDGAGSWPDVPFGAPGDSLEYTLWIVIDVGGTWYTSGCIQFWRGLDRNGGPPSEYAKNWYYDSIRWAPMTGHQPSVGERVGFFVTAGNERNVVDGSCCSVQERSDLVVVPFPTDAGAVFTF